MQYKKLLQPRTANVTHDAGFFRRFLSFLIDVFVLDLFITIPFTPLFTQLVARADRTGVFELTYTSREFGAIIMLFLIVYLYFVLFEYTLGQTIGMMIMGTHVKTVKLWQHFVRRCFLIPTFPFVLFWLIEPLSILFFRRGILEQLSNTRTLYERRILI